MQTKVQKWGNSLAIRIPRAFAKETALANGTIVDLSIRNGQMILKPIPEPRYSLDDLLVRVTKRNLHAEIDFGEPVGREVW